MKVNLSAFQANRDENQRVRSLFALTLPIICSLQYLLFDWSTFSAFPFPKIRDIR